MTYKQAIKSTDRINFEQVNLISKRRMDMRVVVHGMTYQRLMVKLKHSDKSWAKQWGE